MRFQEGMTLRERVQLDVQLEMEGLKMDGGGERYYEPVRHDAREIVQETEMAYQSKLVPWEEACLLLGESSVSADVVRSGPPRSGGTCTYCDGRYPCMAWSPPCT